MKHPSYLLTTKRKLDNECDRILVGYICRPQFIYWLALIGVKSATRHSNLVWCVVFGACSRKCPPPVHSVPQCQLHCSETHNCVCETHRSEGSGQKDVIWASAIFLLLSPLELSKWPTYRFSLWSVFISAARLSIMLSTTFFGSHLEHNAWNKCLLPDVNYII